MIDSLFSRMNSRTGIVVPVMRFCMDSPRQDQSCAPTRAPERTSIHRRIRTEYSVPVVKIANCRIAIADCRFGQPAFRSRSRRSGIGGANSVLRQLVGESTARQTHAARRFGLGAVG